MQQRADDLDIVLPAVNSLVEKCYQNEETKTVEEGLVNKY
jgi:hypothetical protein